MAKFLSQKYPRMIVHVPGQPFVRFEDGELETEDKAVIAELERMAKDGDGSIVATEKPKRKRQPKPKPKADEPKAEEPVEPEGESPEGAAEAAESEE